VRDFRFSGPCWQFPPFLRDPAVADWAIIIVTADDIYAVQGGAATLIASGVGGSLAAAESLTLDCDPTARVWRSVITRAIRVRPSWAY